MDENEEFEFRARAEQEARERAAALPPLMPPPKGFPQDEPTPANPWEDAQAGIASTASRAVRGIGTTLLPKTAEAFMERQGILPTEQDVSQLHEMAGQSGYGKTAEIGSDIALSALPIAKGAQLIQKLPGAARLPTTAAYLGDIGLNAGYNAMLYEDAAEGAKAGAIGGAIARPATALAGWALPKVLGATTGAGSAPIRAEFARGRAGLPTDMRSAEPAERISQAYRQAKDVWANGPRGQIKPNYVYQELDNALGELRDGDIWKVPNDQRAILEIRDFISGHLADPANRTPARMDSLKQGVRNMVDRLNENQSKKVMNRVTRAISDSIDQSGLAPGYREAMAESAARSGVLEGGQHPLHNWLPSAERILPSSTIMRGVGLGGLGAGIGAGMYLNPKTIALAPALSPRLVGEGARAAGRVAGMAPESGHAQLVNAILAALRGNQSGEQNAP